MMTKAKPRSKREKVTLAELIPGSVPIKEAAKRAGLSYSQMWRYVKSGWLPSIDTPFGAFIKETELLQFQPLPKGNPAFRTRNNPALKKKREKRRKKT